MAEQTVVVGAAIAQAVAAVLAAGVTAWYAWLTHGIVRATQRQADAAERGYREAAVQLAAQRAAARRPLHQAAVRFGKALEPISQSRLTPLEIAALVSQIVTWRAVEVDALESLAELAGFGAAGIRAAGDLRVLIDAAAYWRRMDGPSAPFTPSQLDADPVLTAIRNADGALRELAGMGLNDPWIPHHVLRTGTDSVGGY